MPAKKSEYLLSIKAERDLLQIANYTIETFGIKQAINYKKGVIQTFVFIAFKPELGRDFTLNNGDVVKRFTYKSHIIFFKPKEKGILIIRILGNRMNFNKHFK